MTSKVDPTQATVQDFPGGYHLVTYASWQVSVMADGMISLPKICRPQDVDDFIAAMQAAKDVGLKQIDDNNAAAAAARENDKAPRPLLTKRQNNSVKAKADISARSEGPRGATKTELPPNHDKE